MSIAASRKDQGRLWKNQEQPKKKVRKLKKTNVSLFFITPGVAVIRKPGDKKSSTQKA